MNTILKTTVTLSVLTSVNVIGATYYSTGDSNYPTSGANWNDQADGLGNNGTSGLDGTIAGNHDLHMQVGDILRTEQNVADSTTNWTINSLTLAGEFQSGNLANQTTTFSGGDITVVNGASWNVRSGSATVNGTSKLVINSGVTLNMRQSWNSQSSGSLDMNLMITGAGTIALNGNRSGPDYFGFGNISTSFTGLLDASTSDDIQYKFAAGNGTSMAHLQLGNLGKYVMDSNTSFADLTIDGYSIADGTYTYAELIQIGTDNTLDFSDNLVDGAGVVSVGVIAVPEAATSTLFGLAGLTFLARRRR